MLCENYSNMSHVDKIKFIGELIHSVQSDAGSFGLAEAIIALAKHNGILDGITILPNREDIIDN